jgi:hypothetical protein
MPKQVCGRRYRLSQLRRFLRLVQDSEWAGRTHSTTRARSIVIKPLGIIFSRTGKNASTLVTLSTTSTTTGKSEERISALP